MQLSQEQPSRVVQPLYNEPY